MGFELLGGGPGVLERRLCAFKGIPGNFRGHWENPGILGKVTQINGSTPGVSELFF